MSTHSAPGDDRADPGLSAIMSERRQLIAFDVAGDRIKRIWAVRNPEKLRAWTTD